MPKVARQFWGGTGTLTRTYRVSAWLWGIYPLLVDKMVWRPFPSILTGNSQQTHRKLAQAYKGRAHVLRGFRAGLYIPSQLKLAVQMFVMSGPACPRLGKPKPLGFSHEEL